MSISVKLAKKPLFTRHVRVVQGALEQVEFQHLDQSVNLTMQGIARILRAIDQMRHMGMKVSM